MEYVLGLDFGTDSVRALICNVENGDSVGQAVSFYPRWKRGEFCDPAGSRFRQHPLDYIESMEDVVRKALDMCPPGTGGKIRGISVDTTGSTPVMADSRGTPLGMKDEFRDNPNALFILWKDHTSVNEAAEINRMADEWPGLKPTAFVGGIYSSEWFWAKALHVLRIDERVAGATATILEHCDWIPALLTGVDALSDIKRSRCAAGHKALWNEEFGGYPDREFFTGLYSGFGKIYDSLGTRTFTSDTPAGRINAEWAGRLGVSSDCMVGIGAFDAHMGAVGAGIREYQLARVMGTSTCDILVAPPGQDKSAGREGTGGESLVQGICGQVDGSVIPGLIGYEAGQSAFGDVYAWFRDLLVWPVKHLVEKGPDETIIPGFGSGDMEGLLSYLSEALIPILEAEAGKVDPVTSGVLALDWLNGRRTPDADQNLRGAIMGLHLGSDAPRIYRALIEATAFGARAIVDRFRSQNVPIRSVVALGGIPRKATLVMQIMADVLEMEISVSAEEQACALGAAIFASVAAGLYTDVEEARDHMNPGFSRVYKPNPAMAGIYRELYREYCRVGECEENLASLRRLK